MDENNKVKISSEDFTKLDINTQSVNAGLLRVDKKVIIDDGTNKKVTSSIMMGYNKDGITLGDGSFVNTDDIIEAINDALERQEEGTLIVDKKGNPLDIQNLIEQVKKIAGAVIVGQRSSKILNQDSRNWSVQSTDGRVVNKGVAFLGNNGIHLESGEYVSFDEFQLALKDYVFKTPEPLVIDPPKPPEIDPPKPPEIDPPKPHDFFAPTKPTVRVVAKRKMPIAPFILAITMFLASGIRLSDNEKEIIRNKIVEHTKTVQTLDYDVHAEEKYFENSEEAAKRIMSNLKMGDDTYVTDGLEFNQNSLETGISKTMGDEFTAENKMEGMYRVTGFSIVSNGNIVDYIEDFNGLDDVIQLKDFIEKTVKDNNLKFEDIQIKIHVGNNQDFSRLGWIDITDLINANTITNDMIQEKARDIAIEQGTVDDFKGEYITLNNGVRINIYDENHNLITPGTTVIGSDGKEYIINDLNLSENTQVFSEIVEIKDKVIDGKKISWSITDCSLLVGLTPAIATIATYLFVNKLESKKPTIIEFETEKGYEEFKRKFEEAKEKYENSSKFKKVLKKVFFGKKVDVMQRLTDEQIRRLYSSINRHAGIDFVMGTNDKIDISNGKVLVKYEDGHILDITDIVMPEIQSIGSHNPVEAEGYLKGVESDESKTK